VTNDHAFATSRWKFVGGESVSVGACSSSKPSTGGDVRVAKRSAVTGGVTWIGIFFSSDKFNNNKQIGPS